MKNFTKNIYLKICSCFLVFTLLFSVACSGTAGEQRHFSAFNNVDITVQVRGKTLSTATAEKIRELLKALNDEFSATKEGSAVFEINAADAGIGVAISERFKFIAETCATMREFTMGKFDPSVYPLSVLWQFSPSFPVSHFTVPTDEEIMATKALIGYDKFSFTDGAVKSVTGAKLDFGGALKGYAADEIAKIMKADGITGGYINVGGSSINVISADSLSIVHPRKRDDNILTVKLFEKDLAVSTSGDYEKNYTKNGKTYSHLIDPDSGYPAETGVASATVIGKNGLKLDALTTALCLFCHNFANPQNGELYKFIQKILSDEDFNNAQVFIVCVDGENRQILTNKKQGENFTLLDTSYRIIQVGV